LAQIALELVQRPHVVLGQPRVPVALVLVPLLHRVVGQMDGFAQVVHGELLRAEAQVAVPVRPDAHLGVRDAQQHVLPDVKLGAVDQEGSLWRKGNTFWEIIREELEIL